MVDPQASQFWQAALRSGLIDVKALSQCAEAIPPERRTADAIDRRLARQTINLGHLSLWQAQQMLSGRTMGFKVDRYILLDLLGQGGMGRVYLAKDTRLGRKVALKVLSRERMNNARAIARFQREAKVGAQLQHENLVRVYDEGEAQGIRFLVMEYIEGKNVGRLIGESGALPWAFAARIARGIASGLEHASKKGLVHRDVNPFNIMVTADGTAKLTDLGLAFDLADEGNVTRDGATVGTFDYVAPEQARNSHSVDIRSDIYSLGCTLYHMLAGRPPFPMPSLPEKLYGHQSLEPASLRDVAPNVPEGLAAVVSLMMKKVPEERYQDPRDVVDALEPYANEDTSIAFDSDGTSDDALNDPDQGLMPGDSALGPNRTRPIPRTRQGSSESNLKSLALDLGPEPGLVEGLSVVSRKGPRGRSASRSASDDTRAKPSRKRRVFVALVVLVIALLGITMTITLSGLIPPGPGGKEEPTPPVTNGAGKTEPPPPVSKTPDTSKKTAGAPATKPAPAVSGALKISVLRPDGSLEASPDLATAINIAVGGRGEVILGAGDALRVTPSQTIRIQRGNLTIRAEDGTQPVLSLDDAGTRPFIETIGSASLTIRGIRVIARFTQKNIQASALISAGGPLTIDRCTFQARGQVASSSIVKGFGSGLHVKNSLIDGFDRPFDLKSPPGSEVGLSQTIFHRPRVGDEPLGWVLRLQKEVVASGPNRNKPRKLTIERCTFLAEGLLDLVDFAANAPLTVEVKETAIQAKSLLSWHSADGAAGKRGLEPKSLLWHGKGNRFEVTGDSWIVLSPLATLGMPGSPKDLKTWAESHEEIESREVPITLTGRPDAISSDEFPKAADFALRGAEASVPLGADPSLVGAEAPASKK